MKQNALKFINPILALLFIATFVSVMLYNYGPEAWRGSESLGQMHRFSGILFFFIALIHLYFNWGWVKVNIFGIKPRKSSKTSK